MKVSVVDLPAFRIIADALYEIAQLGEGDAYLAPAIARGAAKDAVAVVQEQRRT